MKSEMASKKGIKKQTSKNREIFEGNCIDSFGLE
jgi:hypothetical protein